ncbi:MAG: O-antigen ligase family protein [Sphingobacteriaceae bacterium]|nr:O-antigen ligase family protein [Sphingobacteriaceae bacterium]
MAPLIWVGVQMPNAAKKLIKAFVCGALLSGILSIIAYLFKYPILQGRIDTIFYWTVFRGHLLHDVFLAIASNFILWSILDSTAIKTSQRLWLILAYLVCLVDIMFLVQGRTGEVMMLGMNLLVILFRFKVRGVLYALLTAIIVIPLLYQFAPAVKAGIASYRNDQVQLQYGNTDTSTGLRHQFHQNTWVIIKQAPLIGHGTGSFTQQYSKLIQGTTQMPTSNPHSDWLLIGAEWGLLGVLLVVWIVISNFWVLLKLSDSSRAMGVALLTGYLIATTQNSFFMDNVTGFAFIFLSLSLIKLGELNSSEHKISCTDKL